MKQTNQTDTDTIARQYSLQWLLNGGLTAGYKYTIGHSVIYRLFEL